MSEHGGDAVAVARMLGVPRSSLLDLSASMNPLAPDVRPIVRAAVDSVADYPDPDGAEAALAEAFGIERSRFVLTNGGAEAIALVAHHVQVGDVRNPEFSLYRRHLAKVESGAPLWRSNPSSPFGRLAEPGDEAAVWDEAFYAIATGRWTAGHDTAWTVGSLTKIWACPGLRVGYVIAPTTEDAVAIRRARPRWSVNSLAVAVVEPMLALTELAAWRDGTTRLRNRLVTDVAAAGFDVTTTDANWVLVRCASASVLRRRLADFGVVVRDCTSFGLADTVRVAVPRDEWCERVADAFARASETDGPR